MSLKLPFTLPEHAKVWIYQADRAFSADEKNEIQQKLAAFTRDWNAHGVALAAEAHVLFDYFIVLAVNEDVTPASGCSIDSSVQLMKTIEQALNCSLTNRLNAVVMLENKPLLFRPAAFKEAIHQQQINADTLIFDNTVTNLHELTQNWLKPIHLSWQKKHLSTIVNN